ncbi:hypothetical protein [Sutcliffiella sp. NC1]|uniref:hypothetical protein n=1 Tax=Sutcliffiella sp. NC1 TaxID=3004096 RepID=UPI0022DDA925|nr:hypothetical protein [Sutcliffiella sp. NC1]WBL16610.1 hypothetical protein O1A01_08255 [Sutcliffiella sp. NC1]
MGNAPNADFQEKSVVFIGLQESGSCPYKLKEITIDKAKKAITVPFSDTKGNCTADATPRTFVLELENEMIRDIEELIIVQSGYTTEMPFTN